MKWLSLRVANPVTPMQQREGKQRLELHTRAQHPVVIPCQNSSITVQLALGQRQSVALAGGKGYPSRMTFTRILSDPKRMNGQPCIRDLRLTVRRVVEAVATYPDREELKREYPELQEEDIREALAYAAAHLDDQVIELPVGK